MELCKKGSPYLIQGVSELFCFGFRKAFAVMETPVYSITITMKAGMAKK